MKYMITLKDMATVEKDDFQNDSSIIKVEKLGEELISLVEIKGQVIETRSSRSDVGRMFIFEASFASIADIIQYIVEARKKLYRPELLCLYVMEDQIL